MSEKADIKLKDYLRNKGHELKTVDGSFVLGTERHISKVSETIRCHPDVYYCNLGDDIFEGNPKLLGNSYPDDVLYNAARVGSYFICSKYTSKELISKAQSIGCELITVPQGYVKCNLAVVDEQRVITEDEGIFSVLSKPEYNIQCLLVARGQVSLQGYKYGFIGGASGRVGDEMIFNGNLEAHTDFEKIKNFLSESGVKLRYFSDYPLTDIGSILCVL